MIEPKISGVYSYDFSQVKRINYIYKAYNNILERLYYHPRSYPSIGLLEDFQKEKNHFQLNNEVYILEGRPWFLSPTSQSIAYPLTYSDASLLTPFKWYQSGSVYRNQSKSCTKLIRSKEIKFFHQAHGIFSKIQDAKNQINLLLKVLSKFLRNLGIPHVVNIRPVQDTFAGAQSTYAFDTVTPKGKVIQIMTLHYLGDNFSKVYKPGPDSFYGVCFGTSQRLLGVLNQLYGSNLSLVCNPYSILPSHYLGLETTLDRKAKKSYLAFKRLAQPSGIYSSDKKKIYSLATKTFVQTSVFKNDFNYNRGILIDEVFRTHSLNEHLIDPKIYGTRLK